LELVFYNKVPVYFIVIAGLILCLILPAYTLIFSLGLFIVLAYLSKGKKVFIFLIVVSYLTVTREMVGNVRTVLQYLNILILFYLFTKEYGLDFLRYPKLPKVVVSLFLLLFTSMIIATIFSDYRILGIQEIIRTIIFFIIMYIIYSFLEDNNDIRILLISIFTAGLFFSFVLMYAFYVNDFNLVQVRINTNYLNINGWGAYIMIIFSIALSYHLGLKRNKFRVTFFLLFVIFLISIFITNSRGSILALVVSTFFLIYNINKKLFKISLVLILLIIPILFINPISQFIDLYFRINEVTTGRNIIWSTILGVIKDNPILGVGPAASKYFLYNHLTCMIGSPAERLIAFHYGEIEFGHAHNFYLFFWSDLGILGLITSVFLPYCFFQLGYKNLRKLKDLNKEYYYLTLGVLAAGLGMFVRGIYEWSCLISYGTITDDMPFWLLFILLLYIYFKEIKKDDKILS
jgi:O-antigen ligase